MGTRELLLASVVPGAIAAVVLAGLWLGLPRLLKKKKWESGGPALALPVLIAAGMALGSWAWQSDLALWPANVTQRFPAVAIAILAAGLGTTMVPHRFRLLIAPVLSALGGGFAAWAFLAPLPDASLGAGATWGFISLAASLAAAMGLVLEASLEKLAGWAGPALLSMVAGISALAATQGWANAPLVIGPVAATLAAAVIPGLFYRDRSVLPGAGAALAVALTAAAVFSNWLGDEVSYRMFTLLALAPLSIGVVLIPYVAKRSLLVRLAIAAALSLGLAGAQAAIALPELMEAVSPGDDAYDYY